MSNELEEFEIWSEGYRATGESGGAHLHAKVKAESFEQALLIHSITNKEFLKNLTYSPNPSRPEGSDFTYWGCRLFDNEEDARKSFG